MSDIVQRLDEERRNTEQKLVLPLRNPLCIEFERLLTLIVEDQASGKSNFFADFQHEYGVSCTASIAMAADIQRLRMGRMNKIVYRDDEFKSKEDL